MSWATVAPAIAVIFEQRIWVDERRAGVGLSVRASGKETGRGAERSEAEGRVVNGV